MKKSFFWPAARVICTVCLCATAQAEEAARVVPVPGYAAPAANEHPRLFFRKADLPKIKERAAAPEGAAIVARLRFLLDGKTGDTFPTAFNTNKPVNTGAKGSKELPVGAFTMGHAAGYAMLYQLTGEQKYADLSRRALEKFFAGTPDRDERYTWTSPGAGLRTGMMLTCVAMAYDLAFDGWPEEFRKKVVEEIQNYKHVCVSSGGWEGGKEGLTFEKICNPYYPPGSNHYGALIGGAGIAILAIQGDAGADGPRLEKLRQDVEKNTVNVLTKGFGDGGFFAEGPGPSHMAANTSLVPALQAWKVAGGRDFIAPGPNAQWLTLRWAFEIMEGSNYPCRNPSSYGIEHFNRSGTSDGGEFCQGFGAIPPNLRPALSWTYKTFVEPVEAAEYKQWLPGGERSFDAMVYPHRAVLSLINWPIGEEARNPSETLGHAYRDSIHGYYAFRNQWRDADDILVTMYLKHGPGGFIKCAGGPIMVWGLGMRTTFPVNLLGKEAAYEAGPDGSGFVSVPEAGGTCCTAVDFSGKSGAPLMIVMAAPSFAKKSDGLKKDKSGASSQVTTLAAGKGQFMVMTLQKKGDAPVVRARGDAIAVGEQTVRWEGEKLVLGQ